MSNTKRFILRHSQLPALSPGSTYFLDKTEDDILHQLTSVFRCKTGDQIILMNLNSSASENQEYHFKITELSKKGLQLTLENLHQLSEASTKQISLAICLPNKPAKLELILEKAVELGAREIHLIKSDLSNFSHQLRLDRLGKIVIEASEQSERAICPKIYQHNSIPAFINATQGPLIVAMERDASAKHPSELSKGYYLVGPEGGFSENEKKLLSDEQRVAKITLGPNILKTETAVIVGLGLLQLI